MTGIVNGSITQGSRIGYFAALYRRVTQAVSPLIDLLARVLGPTDDDRIANFSLSAARDWAWHVAQVLAPLPRAAQDAEIALLDRLVEGFGRQLWHPDPPF